MGQKFNNDIYNTPHYDYAIGSKHRYIDYFYKHYGKGLIEDHFPEKFDILIEYYKNGGTFPPVLIKHDNVIIDGGHRCAILMADGKETIRAYKEKKTNNHIMPVKKKMLVIGGSGGVGKAFASAIDQYKYDLYSLSSKELNVTQYSEDIYASMEEPDIVICMAGVAVTTIAGY